MSGLAEMFQEMKGRAYPITNQRALRRAFWEMFPQLDRRRTRNGDYRADTRMTWCDYIDMLARDGQISDALAQRATLEG